MGKSQLECEKYENVKILVHYFMRGAYSHNRFCFYLCERAIVAIISFGAERKAIARFFPVKVQSRRGLDNVSGACC
jgi:hypothetical protein